MFSLSTKRKILQFLCIIFQGKCSTEEWNLSLPSQDKGPCITPHQANLRDQLINSGYFCLQSIYVTNQPAQAHVMCFITAKLYKSQHRLQKVKRERAEALNLHQNNSESYISKVLLLVSAVIIKHFQLKMPQRNHKYLLMISPDQIRR